jgi:hypothetical protein
MTVTVQSMAAPAHEPRPATADPAAHLAQYLDYYREAIARKLDGLSDDRLRTSRLPSGWSPIELLSHLLHMEQRWFVWGFLAEPVADPFGDSAGGVPDGRWQVPDDVSAADLLARLRQGGRRTTQILATTPLDQRGAVGGRFTAAPTPTLLWIGFHVLQEYARHAGHLDIARELEDGATGE